MHVASYRVVAHAPAVIRWRPTDQDGEQVAATGTPTVAVTRSDGTAVTPVTIGIDGDDVALTLTVAQTAQLDRLTVSWLLDGVVRGSSTVDVVGRVFLPVTSTNGDGIRNLEPSLAETSTVNGYPDAALRRARTAVEATFQRACGHVLSFVPRFDTAVIQQAYRGPVVLPHYFVSAVRWARYQGTPGVWTSIDLTSGVTLDDGYVSWNAGWWPRSRIEVGYEHGLEVPPEDVKVAAAAAVRRMVTRKVSAVDPRAISHTMPGGEVQRFPTPGLGPWVTGIPEIDEVLKWYRDKYPVLAVA